MSTIDKTYTLEEDKTAQELTFYFISKGLQDVVKVIQYSFVEPYIFEPFKEELKGKNIYNLGFGDYDLENDTIEDNVNTNNGDAYKVFNTVLSTISVFFENYSNDILMVQGSDGRPEFVESCKLTCKKRCLDECKNYNRRIAIYRSYVDKNYEQLSNDYQFLGGLRNQDQETVLELYKRYKKYDSVFLFRKCITL